MLHCWVTAPLQPITNNGRHQMLYIVWTYINITRKADFDWVGISHSHSLNSSWKKESTDSGTEKKIQFFLSSAPVSALPVFQLEFRECLFECFLSSVPVFTILKNCKKGGFWPGINQMNSKLTGQKKFYCLMSHKVCFLLHWLVWSRERLDFYRHHHTTKTLDFASPHNKNIRLL